MPKQLAPEQQKALDKADNFECLLCDCEYFTPRPGISTCGTPGCHHDFSQHKMPRKLVRTETLWSIRPLSATLLSS